MVHQLWIDGLPIRSFHRTRTRLIDSGEPSGLKLPRAKNNRTPQAPAGLPTSAEPSPRRDQDSNLGGLEHQLRRTVFQTVHPDWKSGLQNTKSFFLAPLLRDHRLSVDQPLTGRQPTKRTHEMLCYYLVDWVDEDDHLGQLQYDGMLAHP